MEEKVAFSFSRNSSIVFTYQTYSQVLWDNIPGEIQYKMLVIPVWSLRMILFQ